MADETGQKQEGATQQPVNQGSVPPGAQALSSTDIDRASEGHPAFQMPPGWGEQIGLGQEGVRL